MAVVFVIVCAMVDLFPWQGRPYFRYTGSDPIHEVWNLGWPVALAIYDPRSGIHPGPFLYVVVPVQVLLASLCAVILLFQRRRNKALQQAAPARSVLTDQ